MDAKLDTNESNTRSGLRQQYVAPQLMTYGALSELTAGGTGSIAEMKGTAGMHHT